MANSGAGTAGAGEVKQKRSQDAEIVVISKIGKMIGELDGASRTRVLAYLHARYCVGSEQQGGN